MAAERMEKILEEVGEEIAGSRGLIYLATVSRVLPETLRDTDLCDVKVLTRKQVAEFFLDALNNPAGNPLGGRPPRRQSVVEKLVVFKESHNDGDAHFHVAARLLTARAFAPAKRALRQRHRLPSHWSCSHTHWWSAVRYGVMPSPRKPEEDKNPFIWPPDKRLDLFAEAQEPYTARAWKARREEKDKKAAVAEKPQKFSKSDLTSVILSEGLRTRASVIAYAKRAGTSAMQAYVDKNIRKLDEFVEDALEWGKAEETEQLEKETDWALVCRTAASECPAGDACEHRQVAAEFFQQNSASFGRKDLALALRAILVGGPSKQTRVPLLVGTTNTGKSTVVLPFDALFGYGKVLHKPAPKSSFALRNISKGKRFIFWGDYRPVEYACLPNQPVSVDTFLSLFQGQWLEVAASQSFHDGNMDCRWTRGAVMTAKLDGLWKPCPERGVSAEDVEHMQQRVHVFFCAGRMSKEQMKKVEPCACCMAKWIVDGSAFGDAVAALQPMPPARALGADAAPGPDTLAGGAAQVEGFFELAQSKQIPDEVAKRLEREVADLGAASVGELSSSDWQSLASWPALRPLQQRRLLACVR